MNKKGFTLIELLIVIVIIGILAAVLITVINPQRQQNRARDASVTATINKIVLATEGYNSAYGDYPDGNDFLGNLEGAVLQSGCADADDTCEFEMTNVELDNTCGGGTSQCYFYYRRDNSGADPEFFLYAKSFGLEETVFVHSSASSGEILRCSTATGGTSDPGCPSPLGYN